MGILLHNPPPYGYPPLTPAYANLTAGTKDTGTPTSAPDIPPAVTTQAQGSPAKAHTSSNVAFPTSDGASANGTRHDEKGKNLPLIADALDDDDDVIIIKEEDTSDPMQTAPVQEVAPAAISPADAIIAMHPPLAPSQCDSRPGPVALSQLSHKDAAALLPKISHIAQGEVVAKEKSSRDAKDWLLPPTRSDRASWLKDRAPSSGRLPEGYCPKNHSKLKLYRKPDHEKLGESNDERCNTL